MPNTHPPTNEPGSKKRPNISAAPYSIADGKDFVFGCAVPMNIDKDLRLRPIFGRFPPLPWWHPNDPDCIRPKYSILRLGPRIELRDSNSGFVHARCGLRNHAHSDSLVIAVDGACPRNGTGATTSSIGVYFGPGNENNLSAKIPDELAGFSGHTNNRAEIYAAIAGLKIARTLCERRGQRPEKRSVKAALERKWIVRPNGNPDRLNHIVIKSDSAYVVSAVGAGDMGEDAHLKKWILNNFQTAKKETQ
ncbi:ribonuclease H-like protein [Colletotrichum asianum]|uniref:ribonuclease H n=1 Tax=Colletotrichum asianum TaxID=702518 RepID=A0A8H3ZPT5_9PEZI|nr:ribonuclease [Colletotrichum asianum]